MKYELIIYLDVLFCLNLIVNYFLIMSAAAVCRSRPPFLRMLLGASVGAAASLAIFLPRLGIFADIAQKLAVCSLMALASFSVKSVRAFLRYAACIFAVTFAYCGIMTALMMIFRPPRLIVNNLSVYYDISPLFLILSASFCYIIIKLICKFLKRGAPESSIYKIEIFYKNKSAECTALLDTGCNLHDMFSGAPVIIIEPNVACSLVTSKSLAAINGGAAEASGEERLRLIPYSAIGTKGFMPAFTPEKAVICRGEKRFETSYVTVAVGDKLCGEYSALIGADLAEMLN